VDVSESPIVCRLQLCLRVGGIICVQRAAEALQILPAFAAVRLDILLP